MKAILSIFICMRAASAGIVVRVRHGGNSLLSRSGNTEKAVIQLSSPSFRKFQNKNANYFDLVS